MPLAKSFASRREQLSVVPVSGWDGPFRYGHATEPRPTLASETLASDSEGPSLLVARGVLTYDECAAWRRLADANGFELQRHAATKRTAHRENGRIAFTDHELAVRLWERLREWVPTHVDGKAVTGLNSNFRLYKYEVGQRFGPHIDESNRLSPRSATVMTVLVYLNGGVEGGETVFYEGRKVLLAFSPSAGAALVHAHGDRCLTHEGAQVRRGSKYVMRTDVVAESS